MVWRVFSSPNVSRNYLLNRVILLASLKMNDSGKRSDVDYDLVAYYYDLFFGDDEEANYAFGDDEEGNYDQLKLQEEENFVSGRLEADVNTYYETIECNEPSDPNDGSTRKRKRDD